MKNDASINLGSFSSKQLLIRSVQIVDIHLSKVMPTLCSESVKHFSRKFRSDKLVDKIEDFISGRRPNEIFQAKITGNILSIENDKLNLEIPLYFDAVSQDLYENKKTARIRADRISDISYYDTMIRNCEKKQYEIEEKMKEAYFAFSTTRNFDPFSQEFEFTINIDNELMFGNFWKFKNGGFSSLRKVRLKDFEKFTQIDDSIFRYHIEEKNVNNFMKLVKYTETFRTLLNLKKRYVDLMTTFFEAKFHPTIQSSYFNEKEASVMSTIMTIKHREHAWIWKLHARYFTMAPNTPNIRCNYELLSEREVYEERVVVA